MRRVLAVVLVFGMVTPAFADIRESAAQQVKAVADARANSQVTRQLGQQSGENPYLVPAVVLMGAGGLVALYGAVHETGAKCSSGDLFDVECKTTKSIGTVIAGGAILGVGAYLFHKGSKKASPQILVGRGGVAVRQQLRW